MRNLALVLVSLLVAAAAVAQSAPAEERHAWEWTLDERLNDRFDPTKIHQRELAVASRPVRAASTSQADDGANRTASGRPFTYEIDGRRNPELFLPFELFDMLLFGLTPDESHRTKQRLFFRKSIHSLGYEDEMFGSSLASVSGDYLEIRNREDCNDKACSDARCTARYDALEAARQLFGEAKFNRILYTVVAPTMQQSTATLDSGHRVALQREEMGCR
jgi:hypothetical protein